MFYLYGVFYFHSEAFTGVMTMEKLKKEYKRGPAGIVIFCYEFFVPRRNAPMIENHISFLSLSDCISSLTVFFLIPYAGLLQLWDRLVAHLMRLVEHSANALNFLSL